MAVPFPALRPTRWELQLSGYRVISGTWRSTEYPEILGSIPEGAVLRLSYENILDADALQLLLLWRATANGRFELDPLPADVAAGITDTALADRLLDITPLVWTVSGEPTRQESIKAGRSSVEIELMSELRMSVSITPSGISCPTYAARPLVGCVGGAGGVGNWPGYELGNWGGGLIPGPMLSARATGGGFDYNSDIFADSTVVFPSMQPPGSAGLNTIRAYSVTPEGIASQTPKWAYRFVDASGTGWTGADKNTWNLANDVHYVDANNLSVSWFTALPYSAGLDNADPATSVQRLYRIRIDTNGNIVNQTTWEKALDSGDFALNGAQLLGYIYVDSVIEESDYTYVAMVVRRADGATTVFGKMALLKIRNSDDEVMWMRYLPSNNGFSMYNNPVTNKLHLTTGGFNGIHFRVNKDDGDAVDANGFSYSILVSGAQRTLREVRSPTVDSDGNIYYVSFDNASLANWTIKLNSDMEIQWARKYDLTDQALGSLNVQEYPYPYFSHRLNKLFMVAQAAVNGSPGTGLLVGEVDQATGNLNHVWFNGAVMNQFAGGIPYIRENLAYGGNLSITYNEAFHSTPTALDFEANNLAVYTSAGVAGAPATPGRVTPDGFAEEALPPDVLGYTSAVNTISAYPPSTIFEKVTSTVTLEPFGTSTFLERWRQGVTL